MSSARTRIARQFGRAVSVTASLLVDNSLRLFLVCLFILSRTRSLSPPCLCIHADAYTPANDPHHTSLHTLPKLNGAACAVRPGRQWSTSILPAPAPAVLRVARRSDLRRASRSARRLRTATAAVGNEALRTAWRRSRFGARTMSGSGSNPTSSRAVAAAERARLRLRDGEAVLSLSGGWVQGRAVHLSVQCFENIGRMERARTDRRRLPYPHRRPPRPPRPYRRQPRRTLLARARRPSPPHPPRQRAPRARTAHRARSRSARFPSSPRQARLARRSRG
ncbi:hypothetical protein BJV78DRAFT_201591 [Lactifluus subvellereus]|nr:hypothetical protein BJV78DRAFT_201591 [Lactifluus subvellereus]